MHSEHSQIETLRDFIFEVYYLHLTRVRSLFLNVVNFDNINISTCKRRHERVEIIDIVDDVDR